MVGALASGLTNAVTYTIDDLGTDITSLPENTQKTSIHQIGHGGQISGAAQMRDAIKTHHMKQVKTLVTRLKSIPEEKVRCSITRRSSTCPKPEPVTTARTRRRPWFS